MRTGSSAFSSVQRRRSELLLGEEDGDVKAAEDRMWSQCSLQLCVSAEKRRSCNLQPSPHHPALGLHLRPTLLVSEQTSATASVSVSTEAKN